MYVYYSVRVQLCAHAEQARVHGHYLRTVNLPLDNLPRAGQRASESSGDTSVMGSLNHDIVQL